MNLVHALEAVPAAELQKLSAQFSVIKQVRSQSFNGDHSLLERQFELHVQGILERLEVRLPAFIDPKAKKAEVLMAKYGLYDAVFLQIIAACGAVSPQLAEAVKQLRITYAGIVDELQQTVSNYSEDMKSLNERVLSAESEFDTLNANIYALQGAMVELDKEAELQNRKIIELRQHLREAAQEINYLREITPNVSKARTTPSGPMTSLTDLSAAVKQFAPPQSPAGAAADGGSVSSASSWNNNTNNIKGYEGATSRRKAPPVPGDFHDVIVGTDNNNNYNNNYNNNGGRTAVGGGGSIGGSTTGGGRSLNNTPYRIDNNNNNNNNSNKNKNVRSINGAHDPFSLKSSVQWLNVFRSDCQKAIDEGRCRDITLNECKDLIEKLYLSKQSANEKALQGVSNLPVETMEQHVYRTMEKRYGLRSLAVEHAGMLIKAVQNYATSSSSSSSSAPYHHHHQQQQGSENDIAVFQHIFRNNIEEDFQLVQKELAASIQNLTMIQITNKNPSKDQPTLQAMLDERVSNGTITEDEWTDIMNYLYSADDSLSVCTMLRNTAVQAMDQGGLTSTVNFSDSTTGGGGRSGSIGGALTLDDISTTNTTTPQKGAGGVRKIVMGSSGTPVGKKSFGYDRGNVSDRKRLGYASSTLKIELKAPPPKTKVILKLPYQQFLAAVLDYQLSSHLTFLAPFSKKFKKLDTNVDGVINAADFRNLYLDMRNDSFTAIYNDAVARGDRTYPTLVHEEGSEQEIRVFTQLIQSLDPLEQDRIIFSAAVSCLNNLNIDVC